MFTDPYRLRLKPSIDIAALEELLERSGPGRQLALLTLCFDRPTPEELAAAGLPGPPRAAEGDAPEWQGGERSGTLRFLVEPHHDLQITFHDPELQALWVRARGTHQRGA